MPSTSRQGLRYPASSAAPNVPADLLNLASDVDARPTFRGSGSSYPSSPVVGDSWYHTTYRCEMTYVAASTWRQKTIALVTSDSDRTSYAAALSAASLPLHNGFQVFQTDTNRLWTSNGTVLKQIGGVAGELDYSVITATRGPAINGAGWVNVTGLTAVITLTERRAIRATFQGQATSNVVPAIVGTRILNVTTGVNCPITQAITKANFGEGAHISMRERLDVGTYNYSIQQSWYDGGNAYLTADRAFLQIEDMGPY